MSAMNPVTTETFQTAAFSYTRWREKYLSLILRGTCVVGF